MDPTTHMLMLTSMHAKLTNMQYPVLVLGARVVAGEPGSLLRSRLDRAVVAARVTPEEPVIVSGSGEADAMARSLIERGVDAGRIVVEPEATSTNENLERAHALCPGKGSRLELSSRGRGHAAVAAAHRVAAGGC